MPAHELDLQTPTANAPVECLGQTLPSEDARCEHFRARLAEHLQAPALRAKAAGRWYVPDPRKAEDLERVRERELLRVFETYRQSAARRLKPVRAEALRAGFRKAHREKDYATILAVAAKVPDAVVEEDAVLLRLVDTARLRAEDENGPLFE